MDIKKQKADLNGKINLFTWIGGISAGIALIPLLWAAFQVFEAGSFYHEHELGDFIGGTSGTFASFAGLAFVYVGFLGQRLQILMQQEELEMNRKELQDTRVEIQGQREQLELQNKQFQIQSYENTFFNLLTHLKNSGPLDRLSPVYSAYSQKFYSIDKDFNQDPMGGSIWTLKKNSTEILESKESFVDVLMKLDVETFDVYDALHMLISILEHIRNFPKIGNNHNRTLHNNLSHSEKFVLFYFYISLSDGLSENHQSLLDKFFNEMDPVVYFHISHRDWIKKLRH